jgi:hypothetical protein
MEGELSTELPKLTCIVSISAWWAWRSSLMFPIAAAKVSTGTGTELSKAVVGLDLPLPDTPSPTTDRSSPPSLSALALKFRPEDRLWALRGVVRGGNAAAAAKGSRLQPTPSSRAPFGVAVSLPSRPLGVVLLLPLGVLPRVRGVLPPLPSPKLRWRPHSPTLSSLVLRVVNLGEGLAASPPSLDLRR